MKEFFLQNSFGFPVFKRLKYFFRNAILPEPGAHEKNVGLLPELIGKWFTRPAKSPTVANSTSLVLDQPDGSLPSTSTDNSSASTISAGDERYCYCQGPEHGEMIGCDNSSCPYVWFHFDCLKLSAPPKAKKWFCPDCRKNPQVKKKL